MVKPPLETTNCDDPEPQGTSGLLILAVWTLVGLVVAAFMMYVGWQHNSQDEFHDQTGVHWRYWLFIGFTWFISVTFVPYALAVYFLIWRWLTRRRRAGLPPTI